MVLADWRRRQLRGIGGRSNGNLKAAAAKLSLLHLEIAFFRGTPIEVKRGRVERAWIEKIARLP